MIIPLAAGLPPDAKRPSVRGAVWEQNVEIARRGYRAFTSADPAQILAFLDPEIEIHDFPDVPDTAVYRGPSGFLALVENVLGEFDDLRIEPEEFIAPDADHVVVMARTVGRGKGSGAEVEARVAHLWTIRDGKAIELRLYGDKADALEAVRPKA